MLSLGYFVVVTLVTILGYNGRGVKWFLGNFNKFMGCVEIILDMFYNIHMMLRELIENLSES